MTLMGRGDLDDQRWLDQQVATLGDGIEAARAIWLNWSDLRNVGRLHPGMSPGEYIASVHPGINVLALAAGIPELSSGELAKATGVSQPTAWRAKKAIQDEYPDEPPARVIGTDGKSYPGRVIREVTAEVIEEVRQEQQVDIRIVFRTFERDAGRLLEAYLPHLSNPKFAARFGIALSELAHAIGRNGNGAH